MEKKNIVLIVVAVVVVVGLFFASTAFGKKEKDYKEIAKEKLVKIDIKDYGTILVELDYDAAPISVENFIKLVEDKFYDGLTFHRIMEGFMIQGGGYSEDGERKAANTIKGEFKLNGVDNPLEHKRGVISMARGQDYNSGSAQFFITVADKEDVLDGRYAAFGKVLAGMEVADKIVEDAKPTDDNGSINLDERPVIEKIRLIDRSSYTED